MTNKKNPLEKRVSSINISPDSYGDDALTKYAFSLQFHLSESNIERTEIDRENAEALIEKDFIDLEKKEQQ